MKKTFLSLCIACLGISPVLASDDESVELEIGADVVSTYVWRGQDCGGFSIQPGASLSWKGLSFEVWASAEVFNSDNVANLKEFDLILSYEVGGLTVGVTDYSYCAGKYLSDWTFNGNSTHQLEANLSYDFGPVALAWNTVLTGDDYNSDGDRAYSSYVEISAPFKLGGLECSAAVGACPWEDSFTTGGENQGFNVVNCSFTATKELKGIPFMGQIVYNPQSEATFFVVGVSF